MRTRRHITIVGGGFSGVALAAHLIKTAGNAVRATLLEAGERLGRGIAYGTTSPDHLLNTPAARMSLYGDAPDDFVRWNRERGRDVSPGDFLPRMVYGDYLEDRLVQLCTSSNTCFQALAQTRATDVEPTGDGFQVTLATGEKLHSDTVVLATGHPLPGDPLPKLEADEGRYVRDPWQAVNLDAIAPDEPVLLLGTGLTMVDVALALARRGHRAPIDAISRRGLLPRAHPPVQAVLPRELAEPLRFAVRDRSLRCTLRTVRQVADEAIARGLGWQCVIDSLRQSTPDIWRSLSAADRRRFVGRLRPYWDVHRHRLPPSTEAMINGLMARGALRVQAGRIEGAAACSEGIDICIRARGTQRTETKRYGWVVNCTGPTFDKRNSRGLERRLLERGLLIADPLGLGYLTTEKGLAFGARGPVTGLYLLGPACRSHWWEHTAVPELREQAAALARQLST